MVIFFEWSIRTSIPCFYLLETVACLCFSANRCNTTYTVTCRYRRVGSILSVRRLPFSNMVQVSRTHTPQVRPDRHFSVGLVSFSLLVIFCLFFSPAASVNASTASTLQDLQGQGYNKSHAVSGRQFHSFPCLVGSQRVAIDQGTPNFFPRTT